MSRIADSRARKEERREEVRSRLRAAMLELAREQPFAELRIEQVAGRAGLSRSAFYFYYADKHEMLADTVKLVTDQVWVEADRWWHGEGEPAKLVGDALTGVADLWSEQADVFRLAIEASSYDPEIREVWVGIVGRFVAATAEYIARGQADGRIAPELDAAGTAEAMMWGAERMLYLFVAGGERRPEEVVEPLAAFWNRALFAGV
jgi:AcrR family transcriptional regulator